jgi:hypothetical protein
MLPHVILPLSPLLIQKHYMKVHGVHIHLYGLLHVFGYSFESPLCYGYSKIIHEIHTMRLYYI